MDDIQERLEHLIKITIDPWADLPRIPRGFDKWDAYQREIERREINHNEFLAIFKKSIPEENEK